MSAAASDLRALPQLCELLPMPVFLLHGDGRIAFANGRAAALAGRRLEDLAGRPFAEIATAGRVPLADYLAACAGSGQPLPGLVQLGAAGDRKPFRCYGAALAVSRDRKDRLVFLRCTDRQASVRQFLELNERLHRLTEQLREDRRLQEELRQSLREREVLLREIHHRVRNNLQVVMSMLNLQAVNAASPVLRRELRSAQTRIQAMGLVHHHLYAAQDLASIDLGRLLADLCGQLWEIHDAAGRGLAVRVEAPPLILQMEQAVPLALIATEAVTNALKHAFPAGAAAGEVRVQVEESPAAMVLRVSDDGTGPARRGRPGRGGLGLTLMRALAGQLQGELTLRSGPGYTVEVTMPPLAGRRGLNGGAGPLAAAPPA